ncbi:hypothetical protein G7054_g3481 [Neopestalotiopsis clavispora]|nr:hypothetical protein G7054_g3481 [Neopestalotiopsis clavispora]
MTTTMQNSRLRLLNALRAGSKPIMTFLGLPSARTAQVVASTGLDGVIIDCEHGHISDDAMHDAVTAISAQGVSPLVRIRMTHADLIKRALDAGAHGLVVPMINTAEDARAVVRHAKFPPQGVRGQGSAFPGFAFGIDIPTYTKTANELLITCVQIETRLGVQNVDAICAVPGVVLGYVPAKGDEPEFVDAIDKIIAAARRHGKWVGRLANDGLSAKRHLEVFDTVALSYDNDSKRNCRAWFNPNLEPLQDEFRSFLDFLLGYSKHAADQFPLVYDTPRMCAYRADQTIRDRPGSHVRNPGARVIATPPVVGALELGLRAKRAAAEAGQDNGEESDDEDGDYEYAEEDVETFAPGHEIALNLADDIYPDAINYFLADEIDIDSDVDLDSDDDEDVEMS